MAHKSKCAYCGVSGKGLTYYQESGKEVCHPCMYPQDRQSNNSLVRQEFLTRNLRLAVMRCFKH